MTPSSFRRSCYRAARITGNVQAIASGDPRRMMRREANRVVGRRLVRKMWFK